MRVDYDLDYVVSSDDNSDSDFSDESIPQPVRLKTRKGRGFRRNHDSDDKMKSSVKTLAPSVEKNDLIIYEGAKTSRSKCRKCMQQLEKGE